jgi:hypothetical protein
MSDNFEPILALNLALERGRKVLPKAADDMALINETTGKWQLPVACSQQMRQLS